MFSVGRVGETITFSAGILIAALLSLATATFSLYSGLAAPLAIAIGLMLMAGLTLLPALAGHRRPGRLLAVFRPAGRRAARLVGSGLRPDRAPAAGDAGRRPRRLRRARGGLGRVCGRGVRRGGDRAAGQRFRAGRRAAGRALPADGGQPDHHRAAPAAAGLGGPGTGGRGRAAAGLRSGVHRRERALRRQRHRADARRSTRRCTPPTGRRAAWRPRRGRRFRRRGCLLTRPTRPAART